MSTPKPTAAKTPAIRSCPETRPLDNKDKLPAGIDAVNGSTGSSTAAALFPTLVGIPSNALDELAVALASFSGNRGALPFLNVYNSLAIDFMSRSGLAVDEPAPSVCPTLFGSPEDLEAKRLYATVLAFLFNQQIRANELTGKKEKSTAFSCPPTKAPSIPIREYIERIMKYTPGTKEMYLAALVLVDRVLAMNPRVRLTTRNVHRLFMTSVVVASKFLDDLFYTNRYLATVAGLPAAELNRLEVQFLLKTRFSLVVHQDLFESYRRPFEHLVSIARTQGDLSTFFLEVQLSRKTASPTSSVSSCSAQMLFPVSVTSHHSGTSSSAAAPIAATTPASAVHPPPVTAAPAVHPPPPPAAAATATAAVAASTSAAAAAAAASRSRISKLAMRFKTALGSLRPGSSSKQVQQAIPGPHDRPGSYGPIHAHIASCEGVAFT